MDRDGVWMEMHLNGGKNKKGTHGNRLSIIMQEAYEEEKLTTGPLDTWRMLLSGALGQSSLGG